MHMSTSSSLVLVKGVQGGCTRKKVRLCALVNWCSTKRDKRGWLDYEAFKAKVLQLAGGTPVKYSRRTLAALTQKAAGSFDSYLICQALRLSARTSCPVLMRSWRSSSMALIKACATGSWSDLMALIGVAGMNFSLCASALQMRTTSHVTCLPRPLRPCRSPPSPTSALPLPLLANPRLRSPRLHSSLALQHQLLHQLLLLLVIPVLPEAKSSGAWPPSTSLHSAPTAFRPSTPTTKRMESVLCLGPMQSRTLELHSLLP